MVLKIILDFILGSLFLSVMKPDKSWLFPATWAVCLTSTFLFSVLFCLNISVFIPKQYLNPINPVSKPENHTNTTSIEYKQCDLFSGRWIRDMKGPSYSNWSCPTSMIQHNCLKYGKDGDYINWRWKPNECELHRFNPKAFLDIVRGKTMAFIGDSVAKDQMASLLCLLSQDVPAPINMYTDAEDYFQTWYFPSHDFTLKRLWSPWLVTEEGGDYSSKEFHLHLDKVDQEWSKQLPAIDYAIISGTHWFLRKLYLYNKGELIGCFSCDDTNVTKVDPSIAFRMAFRTALKSVNNCKECKGLVTWLRTSSASHFENGTWQTARCNRTSPLRSLGEAKDDLKLGGASWDFRRIQVEEIGKAKRKGERKGLRFRVLDIANAMYMRPDAHPDTHCANYPYTGYSDCLHWCLPGPVDVWNDMLLAMMKDEDGSASKGIAVD